MLRGIDSGRKRQRSGDTYHSWADFSCKVSGAGSCWLDTVIAGGYTRRNNSPCKRSFGELKMVRDCVAASVVPMGLRTAAVRALLSSDKSKLARDGQICSSRDWNQNGSRDACGSGVNN